MLQPTLPPHISTRRYKRPSRIKKVLNIGNSRSKMYWWVVARLGEREVLLGTFPDMIAANNEGYQTNTYFDVYEFPTKDRARAAQMYKAVRLDMGQDLETSMERLSHRAFSPQGKVIGNE